MEIPLPLHIFLFSTFFFVSSLLCQQQQVNSQMAGDDREQTILLKLNNDWKNPTLNSSWGGNPNPTLNTSSSSSWGKFDISPSFGPHCNWRGITCMDGLVIGIILSNINITKKIPSYICDLKNLAILDLSYNYIPGEFPTSLYNCSKLEKLDLSENYFIGRIPSDIDRISSLRILNLGGNNLTGDIPRSIGRFPFLEILSLQLNQFDGTFPPEISNLSNLQHLGLAYNEFIPSRIPLEFGRLKKLRSWWMKKSNLIGEIPESIFNLTNLRYLDLSSNRLNGTLPGSLFLLKNLTTLLLQDNNLTGEIPRKIETWNLNAIDLSINILTGTIPEDFGKLKYLENFDMYNNRLSGEIPASIGRIPTLLNTRLFRNNLTGVLPPELGLHSKLRTVEVSENQLTGNLPENLCAQGAFYGIVAFSNNLNGTLPKSLQNCSTLYWVMLHNNKFSGGIPADFWSLESLDAVILGDNSFSGEFPAQLGSDFERIEISNNRFYGRIPSQLAGSPNLGVFQASNNLLSGEISFGITALSSLETLSLDGNRLSGQIPSRIISWSSLSTLNLSRNQLSGELPPEIGLLPSLKELDVSENQISGEIPSGYGNLRFSFLNLSSNRLTGNIPVEFENQTYARSFLNNSGLCTGRRLSLNHEACRVESFKDSRKLSSSKMLTMVLIISGVILLVVVLFIIFMIRHSRGKKYKNDLPTIWKLTLFQMLDFTESNILSSLTEDNVIGSGASGKVYRVLVNHSGNNNYVAVKKIWSRGKLDRQLEKQFQAEVQILGTIRHSSIVKLLCCISSHNSKLLVYEYMENGSLHEWIHRKRQGETLDSTHRSVLDWPRRLNIAIGAAQGLCYIHHDCSPPIIHRDVKSSNILLDSEFKARIADFGLAKMVVVNHGEPKTASVVAGSFGYIAPEYARTTKITEKIDVYSFGVVLLELATGRKANHGDEHTCLAEWAWRQYQEGNNVDDALDEDVKKPCYLNEMRMVFKLGLICTGSLPSHRPSMKQTLQILQKHDPIIGAYRVEEEELALPSHYVIVDDTEIGLAPLNNDEDHLGINDNL